jgi:pimeloyl-ACP methyl ester carboxylesterase
VGAPSAVEPFRIAVPQSELDDLAERLDRTRWPDALPGAGWEYGVPLDYLRELAEHWRHTYDWRHHEAELNRLAQFTTTLDGTRVHFIHVRSREPAATPLLILHGWPGSIVELAGLVGPLTDPVAHGGDAADGFHVVAPSLPGYGFSGPTLETGWGVARVTAAMAALMQRLGYGCYGVHGGDWGATIARGLGVTDAERVTGVHLTMLLGAVPSHRDTDPDDPEEQRSLAVAGRYRAELAGYAILQATRPQTLAYALTDSPVGQLAWIAEKFKDWTDSDTVPEDAVDRDQLLTNVMLYWLTRTAGSSARLYWETAHAGGGWGAAEPPSTVPTAVAILPRDLSRPVRRVAERTNRIVRWTELEHGGHFAAMEVPGPLLADIRAFFAGLR